MRLNRVEARRANNKADDIFRYWQHKFDALPRPETVINLK
jgi:hypothetical protein